jgi:hypothetical protein
MIKKAFLPGSIMVLLIAGSLIPVIAQTTQTTSIESQETTLLEKFMNDIEQIASESQNSHEFFEKIRDLCQSNDYSSYPMIHDFLQKILSFVVKNQEFSINDMNIQDILDGFSIKTHPDYLVISYGAYNRLNPRKENSIDHFKERLSMWRYSDTSKLLKGRTLILERQPFGIHQKMIGPQLGFMKGFKGIYIDIESKLTGNSYVFFMGRAHRIRAFDLTPFSK